MAVEAFFLFLFIFWNHIF